MRIERVGNEAKLKNNSGTTNPLDAVEMFHKWPGIPCHVLGVGGLR